ncbi:SufE-like protein 1, chloroplastic/mitochondrial [Podochytrium sp. JEL0797]|nr:SufE-like protein 1, chloroplastic/mitochondrial [Podochytrium sp. JEL0797]
MTSNPLQQSIRDKLTAALSPTLLEITDDSHKHASHTAMRGSTDKETHFQVRIVSDGFQGKNLVQRHQMVYKILDVELKEKGLHALQIQAKTPAEVTK